MVLADTILLVRGSHVQARNHRASVRIGFRANMDGTGGKAVSLAVGPAVTVRVAIASSQSVAIAVSSVPIGLLEIGARADAAVRGRCCLVGGGKSGHVE